MADRSVSINLRARVGDFLVGMRQAKGETTDLGRRMVETGASADRMRRRLEAATKALPKIEIDADSSEAERKFAELRRELESLSSKRIGIDVSSEEARAEIQRIEHELQQLQLNEGNVEVRADIGEAIAQLRAVEGEVSRLDGRTANVRVDADVSGALAGLAMVGSALASIPVATTVGIMGAAFGAAGVGAVGMAAVAVPALGRVNEALKQQESAAGGAGGAVKSAAQTAAEAAQRAIQLEQAERRVSDAKKAARQAEEDLTAARRDARRAIEDLNMSLKDAQLSEEDAALAVEEARQRLSETMADPKATALERERADLSYRQAVARLEDQRVRTQRLQQDTQKANAAGVEGSDQVRAAREKEAKSDQALIDAKKQLELVMLQQKAAMQQAGGAAGGAASKMSELSKAEKALAKDIKAYQDAYLDWQRQLEGDVFPAISGGLKLVQSQLPRISPLVRAAGKSFLQLEKDAAAALEAPFWDEFLKDLEEAMPGAIEGFGHVGMNVMTGLAGVFDAFLPRTGAVVDSIEEATKKFADWGTSLRSNPEFQRFLDYVAQNAPKVMGIVGDLATTIGNLLKAGAGAGTTALDMIAGIADKLAHLSPEQMQAVALGLGAIVAAAKAGTVLKLGAWTLLAELLSKMSPGQIQAVALAIGAVVLAVKGVQAFSTAADLVSNFGGKLADVGKAADGAKGKLSGFVGGLGGLGLKAGAASAGLIILGEKFADIEQSANRYAEKTAALGGTDLSKEIAAVTAELAKQKEQIDWAIFGKLHLSQASADAANRAEALEAKLADLKHQQELEAISAKAAGGATTAMGSQVGEAAGQIDTANKAMQGFQSTMDAFSSRTDLQAALQGLKRDFDNAKTAIEQAGGKLDFTAGMTDKQRNAVINARQEFAGYLTKVQEIAKGQADLATKTGNAATAQDRQKLAILQAAPKMFELAGGSKEAREAIFKLGESAGLSRTQLMHAKDEVSKLRLEISRLQNKTITITATVKGDGTKSIGAGQALHEAGAIERYATGGLRSTAPNVAARPTILYGEGRAPEAFIPYETRYRGRAEKLLAQVASDFGMQVVPVAGPAASAASTSGGGGQAGGIRIVLDPLTRATDNLGRVVARGVTDAAGETADTADQLGSTLESAISDLSSQISALAGSVQGLASSVASAAAAGSSAASSAGGSSATASGASRKAAASKGKTKASAKGSSSAKAKAGGLVEGSAAPVVITPMANGGLARGPVLAGEAGPEVIVPVSPSKAGRGLVTLHQAAGMLGYQVAPRSTSLAPRYTTGGGGGRSPGAEDRLFRRLETAFQRMATGPGLSGSPGGGGVSIDMSGSVIREEADIHRLGAEFGFELRARG